MKDSSVDWRTKALKMSAKIRHRGPDWSGIFSDRNCILAHERLAIVDPLSGGHLFFQIQADSRLSRRTGSRCSQ